MAERDLNLQLRLAKDQARRQLAEFGSEAQALIATDLSQFQAAEQAKVAAARRAASERASDAVAARKAEIDAAIAAEQAKVQIALAAAAQRLASIRATWAAEHAQNQSMILVATQSQNQILAIESSKRAATKATADAQRQQAAQAISQGRELMLASSQNHRQLAAFEAASGQASQERAVVTRSAMQIEIAEAQELGQAYVRVRMVQETQTQSMKQLGGTVAQAMKPGKDAVDNTKNSVEGLGKAFIALQVVQQIGGMIQTAMEAVVQSAAHAREHIRGLVGEMEQARTASRELAALRGEKATGQFTADMAREAAAAGLDVEKYNQVQLGFQAQAAQYIGDEDATPEDLAKRGKKINKGQAKELQQQVASYAVGAKGLSAEDSSRLLGTVISKGKAGATNDEIMSQYAKIMKIAELAPGKTSEIVGQFSELGMESVGPTGDFKNLQQSAYLGRVMAQRNPAEASTYGRALLRGLREIGGSDEKRGELGITKDMDVMQQLEQVNVKAQEHVAKGGKENEFIQKYFPEIREFGAVRTALDEGIRGGGFKRAMAEAESVNADTVRSDAKGYLGSEEGVAANQRSRQLGEERQNASYYAPLNRIKREQTILMRQSHELEKPETVGEAIMTHYGELRGYGNREEQQLRKRTAYDLTSQLQLTKQGREYLSQQFGYDKTGGGRTEGKVSPDSDERTMGAAAQKLAEIKQELMHANQQRAHANQQRDQAQRNRVDHPIPLVRAPQDRGGVRMGG